jgi:hypothetical protein
MHTPPAAGPAAAPPFPLPQNPGWRQTVGLTASRFAGRSGLGGPLGAPFFGLCNGGRWRTLQLAVGPGLAAFPKGLNPRSKLVPSRDLLAGESGLFWSQKARMGLALHRTGKTEVGCHDEHRGCRHKGTRVCCT